MSNMTLLEKITELNKKGISIKFSPWVDNDSTIIDMQIGIHWQNYMLTNEMVKYAKEGVIVEVIDQMYQKLYKLPS